MLWLAVVWLAGLVEGRTFSRCQLARELAFKHAVPKDQIATWVCIAEHESSLNTAAVGRSNWDGSADHGLFQINNRYWCSPGGNACNAACSQFTDDDISDDIKCIKRIFKEHKRLSGNGFNAWAVYHAHCTSPESYIADCSDGDDRMSSWTEMILDSPSYFLSHLRENSAGQFSQLKQVSVPSFSIQAAATSNDLTPSVIIQQKPVVYSTPVTPLLTRQSVTVIPTSTAIPYSSTTFQTPISSTRSESGYPTKLATSSYRDATAFLQQRPALKPLKPFIVNGQAVNQAGQSQWQQRPQYAQRPLWSNQERPWSNWGTITTVRPPWAGVQTSTTNNPWSSWSTPSSTTTWPWSSTTTSRPWSNWGSQLTSTSSNPWSIFGGQQSTTMRPWSNWGAQISSFTNSRPWGSWVSKSQPHSIYDAQHDYSSSVDDGKKSLFYVSSDLVSPIQESIHSQLYSPHNKQGETSFQGTSSCMSAECLLTES